jgi:hypothetical protein
MLLLILLPINTFANPVPTSSPVDDPDVADYPSVQLSMKNSGSGNSMSGAASMIFIYFCPIIVNVPFVSQILVPKIGKQECVVIQGFPRYCQWPFFYRVRATILKQPRCGGQVTATVSGATWESIQVCFNVDMKNSTCAEDFFIYQIEFPRSYWAHWMYGWPRFYTRKAVVKIKKDGVY